MVTPLRRQLLITALVAVIAGLIGAFAGTRLFERSPPSSLHEAVHDELDLDTAQRARIEALEASFAIRRRALELEMRTANAELAAAIQSERGYGAGVTAAVDHFHDVMGRLQKETIEHVFAMRAVLTPAQAARFDTTVVRALTADPA